MCRPEIQGTFGPLAIFYRVRAKTQRRQERHGRRRGDVGDTEEMWGMNCRRTLLTKTPAAFHNKAQDRVSASWVKETPAATICGTAGGPGCCATWACKRQSDVPLLQRRPREPTRLFCGTFGEDTPVRPYRFRASAKPRLHSNLGHPRTLRVRVVRRARYQETI